MVFAQGSVGTVWIPMREAGIFGPGDIKLEATLHLPIGPGPFPVVLFSHGSSGGPIPSSYTETAKAFGAHLTTRGIALLVPMRRGRGRSEGRNLEEPSPCTPEAARQGMAYASASLDAAVAYVHGQAWAAKHELVLAGHSRGGILSVTYAAEHPSVAKGVINFAGGWKDDACGPVDVNVPIFEEAGRTSKTPTLFLYGRGDRFYSDASAARYAARFKDKGGDVEFKHYALDGINGHAIFHRALPLWQSDVDRFLARVGLLHNTK